MRGSQTVQKHSVAQSHALHLTFWHPRVRSQMAGSKSIGLIYYWKHIQKCNIYLPRLCLIFLGVCNICLWGSLPTYGLIWLHRMGVPHNKCNMQVEGYMLYLLWGGGYNSYIGVGPRKVIVCYVTFLGPRRG